MKHVLIAFLFFSPLIVFANIRGGEEQIFLQKNRSNQEIILVADGFVSSYDVDIVSLSTLQIVLFTAVNGYGDTIDVSTLPDDDYKIVISTPYNNVYEGYFTNY